jgi:hypothetical protein
MQNNKHNPPNTKQLTKQLTKQRGQDPRRQEAAQ